MKLAPTDDFSTLVYHVFAHVQLDGPGSSFDPRYVEWAKSVAGHTLDEDAEVLAAHWNRDPALDLLHSLPELHRSLASFRPTAGRALTDVEAGEVARPHVLAALQALEHPAVELIHATLAVVAPELEELVVETIEPALARTCEAVRPWLAQATSLVPELEDATVELAWPLGQHGRAMSGRIVVGAPAAWNELDPITPAVLVLHEHAVSSSVVAGYVASEWSALVRVAKDMQRAGEALRQAHRGWLARLDLGPLLAEAGGRGLASVSDVDRLLAEPEDRAQVLVTMKLGIFPS